jgi:hypothetical protein
MKVGDLVKINRHMLGVPMGSHGIIIKTKRSVFGEVWIHIVQLIGSSRVNTSLPILSRDLEVVA